MIWLLSFALANDDGKPAAAISGCTCHGAPSQNTTLELLADTTTVERGGLVNLTVIVRNSELAVAGLTADSPDGSFAAGLNTVVDRGDVVHPTPVALDDGEASFGFVWTAPDEDTTSTIYTAANAGNDDDKDDGDAWNFGDDLEIVVGTGGDSAADTGVDDEASAEGCDGCSGTPQAGAAGLAAIAVAAALLRRRMRESVHRPKRSPVRST